jgi:hypothetical protein
MSRSGYDNDGDSTYIDLYRANVDRALAGKRGQAFLRELLAALDALPEQALVESTFDDHGAVCALGSVGRARGTDMTLLNELAEYDDLGGETADAAARSFGIATAMAAEIMYVNDQAGRYNETPEQRFARVRAWVVREMKP